MLKTEALMFQLIDANELSRASDRITFIKNVNFSYIILLGLVRSCPSMPN